MGEEGIFPVDPVVDLGSKGIFFSPCPDGFELQGAAGVGRWMPGPCRERETGTGKTPNARGWSPA